ncbi:alpha/beta hydrolase family protein [Actinokineospora sp.]|uniref:alpha/beta hydrolase family protein n=1 Tax=Actinokineospora sp. TaxID=1872133 RepID=UPI00403776FC
MTESVVAGPHVVRYGAGNAQHVLVAAIGAEAAVLLVHGGFWRAEQQASSMLGACSDVAAAGLAAASVEYRTVETGASWDTMVRDVADAVTAFGAATAIPLRRTVLVGHSAGGHLALLAAARLPGLGAVVGLAPVTDLVRAHAQHLGDDAVLGLFGGREPAVEELRAASPLHQPTPGCRILLVHGTADQAVPVEQSSAYARATGAPLRLIDDARHMHLVKTERPAWARVRAELGAMAKALSDDPIDT